MNYLSDLIQFSLFLTVLIILSVLLGNFFYKGLIGEKNILSFILSRPEKFIYSLLKIDAKHEMNWKEYASALMISNVLGIRHLIDDATNSTIFTA